MVSSRRTVAAEVAAVVAGAHGEGDARESGGAGRRRAGGRRAPAEVRWLCEAASARLRAGSAAEALRMADAALRVRPGRAAALQVRGEALLCLRRADEALEALRAAWAARPSPAVGLLMVRAAESALPPDESLSVCRGVGRRFPGRNEILIRLALCCERAGQAGEALAIYRRLGMPGAGSGLRGTAPAGCPPTAGDGWDGFAYTRYIRLALEGREAGEALAEVERLLAFPGRDALPDLHLLRAQLLERLGRPDEAVGACDRARHLAGAARPGEHFFLAQAAFCRRRAGRTAEAFTLLRQILDRDPGNAAAAAAFVSDARSLGRQREARRFLRDLVRRHPERPALWSWLRRLRPPGGGTGEQQA